LRERKEFIIGMMVIDMKVNIEMIKERKRNLLF